MNEQTEPAPLRPPGTEPCGEFVNGDAAQPCQREKGHDKPDIHVGPWRKVEPECDYCDGLEEGACPLADTITELQERVRELTREVHSLAEFAAEKETDEYNQLSRADRLAAALRSIRESHFTDQPLVTYINEALASDGGE